MKQCTDLNQTITLLTLGFNINCESTAFTIGNLIDYLPKYIDCGNYRGYLCILYIGNLWQINYDQDMYRGWQCEELIDTLYETLVELKENGVICDTK